MSSATARWWALGLVLVAGLGLATWLGWMPPPEVDTLVLYVAAVVVSGPALSVLRVGVPVTAPSIFFTVAVALFHLGLLVPWALDWADPPLWLETMPRRATIDALLAILLAFTMLQLGLLLGWQRLGSAAPRLDPTVRPRTAPSALYSGGFAIAGLAFLLALVNLRTIGIGRFFGDSYGHEVFDVTDSRLLQTCLFWLLPASLLVALAGARPGHEHRRALGAVGAVTVLLLWLGDRGDAISLAAAALLIRTYTHGAIPIRTAAPAAIGVLALLAAVAIVRQLPRTALGLADLRTAAADATPLAALTEMGWTFRPLVETVRLVPAHMPHREGASYADAAARLLPNIGLDRADAGWNDPLRLPPNHWITYTVEPWTWAAFGGLGYSAVAEPYLNFGIAGVIGYFLLLGLCLGRLDVHLASGPGRRTLALAAVVLLPLLVTARNDFHNFVRPAVWGVAMVWLIERVHGRPMALPAPLPAAPEAA